MRFLTGIRTHDNLRITDIFVVLTLESTDQKVLFLKIRQNVFITHLVNDKHDAGDCPHVLIESKLQVLKVQIKRSTNKSSSKINKQTS